MRAGVRALALIVATLASPIALAQDSARLFAAGSLRAAMTDIADAFRQSGGGAVDMQFGASGLLRDRLERGERADVFASANLEHPTALAAAKRAGPVVLFARNRLCALAPASLAVTSQNLLDKLLDPLIKVGTSTPKADPSGDYAFELFAKAESSRPGARKTLEAKALKLTGGPDSPPPPKDRNVYAMLVSERKADVFLTYCTNARAAQAEVPALATIAIPDALAVGASYGLTLLAGANAAGSRLALFVMSSEGQRILAKHGFEAPALH